MDPKVYKQIHTERELPFTFKECFNPCIFTWGDVNIVFNNPALLQNITLAGIDTQSIPLNQYQHGWIKTYDRDQIFFGLKNGFTLAVNGIDTYNPHIQTICAALEKVLNGAADVHMYISLTDYSKSFGIHNDYPYNLILQVDGACEWRVWDTKIKPTAEHKPVIHTVLNPGDIIYIPTGVFHQCIPSGKRISLSIPVKPDMPPAQRKFYDLFNIKREELC
jgi:ribosomal protein L16 Arg81 hydroxylase